MKQKGMTIREAAQEWVEEMTRIPYGICEKLLERNEDEITEITPPGVNDRVYVYDREDYGEIIKHDLGSNYYTIEMDDGETIEIEEEDFEVQRDGYLPMWGTLWAFGDSADDYWLEELGGLQIMADCGFRIYEQEDYGYIFGIDGAGYNFYEAHWIPLYRARGLQWHDPEAENEGGAT